MSKNVIFSGVQPTGEIHLGNYLGAIKQFVDYQKDYNSIFSIVDLHAITVRQDPKQLLDNVHKVLSIFLACGLDREKNIIFNQSQVPEHTQLAWLLSCTARVGWLNRMTQFKDKAGKNRENASVGLYTYPILMAADIMLYKASHVPVGDDQKQHLELARDIAHKFNTDYNIDFFVLPEPLFNSDSTRIMSLRDGTKKMSKSDTSDYSRILMTDDNDTISLKIKKAKTDSLSMPELENGLSKRPEIDNLINIYSSCSGISRNIIIDQFSSKEISYFKKELSQVLINLIEPICSEAKKIYEDKNFLNQVLSSGAMRARQISQNTIADVYKIAGMI